MPWVLGHARSMQAMHGGTATNDPIDAHKMAARLCGGRRPEASVSPAERRAPRELLRRRIHLRRQRAARLSPGHPTHAPSPVPESGQNIASQATREGVAARCATPAVHKPMAVDLALLPSDDALLKALALTILQTAQPCAAPTRSRAPPGGLCRSGRAVSTQSCSGAQAAVPLGEKTRERPSAAHSGAETGPSGRGQAQEKDSL
jgi:hypothetical protein